MEETDNQIEKEEKRSESMRPETVEHLLFFIFSTWDRKQPIIKRAVDRYVVGAKSNGAELVQKIEHVICVLYTWGFAVNQVASNGAVESVTRLKLLTTHTAKDVFTSLNPKLPQDTLVAFKSPSSNDRFMFIGGRCHTRQSVL